MSTNRKQGLIVVYFSVVVNILLFILKYTAGIVSGSIALIADAWHTLSDSITSIIVIISFHISGKKADKEHPFGHGRVENIAAIIIATLLAVVAFNFLGNSFGRFKANRSAEFGVFAIVVTIISLLIKEFMAQWSIHISKKLNSPALKADAWHHRSDAITSVLILLGIILGKQYFWIDSVLGILVSAFIIYTAVNIIKDSARSILGVNVNSDFENKIMKIASEVSEKISGIHHLHLHEYGDHMELTLHICLPSSTDIKTVHDICNDLEKAVYEALGMNITIHVEPDILLECKTGSHDKI